VRIAIRHIARQRSVIEVMDALPDIRFFRVEIIERKAVVGVVPTVARFDPLIPVRRRCWVVSA
jgi:hypothetical protein